MARISTTMARAVLSLGCAWPLAGLAQMVSVPDDPGVPDAEHVFGDWGGVRTRLRDGGIDLHAEYTTETAADVAGGLRTGVDYAHQIGLRIDADWAKLAGLDGLSTHMVLVNRAGRSASTDFADDDILHVQEIYGSGRDVLVRLSYLYAEQSLAAGRIQISAGRLPVEPVLSEFAGSPFFCNFMSLAVCGNPRTLTINKAWPNWPSATWGARLRAKPNDVVYADLGLYEVNPRYGGASGFDWSTRGATGVNMPVEFGYTPSFGGDHLAGHYIIGFGWDTSRYAGLSGDGRQHAGLGLGYVLADQMLLRTGPAALQGVTALGGWLHADGTISPIQDQFYAGLLAQGVLPFHLKGTVGLFASYLKLSSAQARSEAASLVGADSLGGATLDEAGLAGGAGLAGTGGLPKGVRGEQTHETVIEVNYQFTPIGGVLLMPDLQYILQPGGTRATPDALFVGLKTNLEF